MKNIIAAVAVTLTVFITGCAGPSYSQFNYEYQAPPEYQLNTKHKTIAATVSGRGLPRHLEDFVHPVEGLNWIDDDKSSHVVFDVRIDNTKLYKDVPTEETVEITDSQGRKKKVKMYSFLGFIHTPYEFSLYDRVNKRYITQVKDTFKHQVQGEQRSNEKSAQLSMTMKVLGAKEQGRREAFADITTKAKRLLDVQLTKHQKNQDFRIPEKDEKEPRLAQAYNILTKQPNEEGAKRAIAIYKAIGTNNKDEKGEDNTDLNEAVYAGLSACHYILGDMAEYERTKELANQFITSKSSTTFTTTSSF